MGEDTEQAIRISAVDDLALEEDANKLNKCARERADVRARLSVHTPRPSCWSRQPHDSRKGVGCKPAPGRLGAQTSMMRSHASDALGAVPTQLCDPETELALIGCLLRNNREADAAAEIIGPDDISEPLFARIYAAIAQQIAAGLPATPPTIVPMFVDDVPFQEFNGRRVIAEATASATAFAPAATLAGHLRRLAVRRRLWLEMEAARRDLEDLAMPTESVIERHDTAVTAAIERTEAGSFKDSAACIDEVIASLDREETGVQSGTVSTMDELLGPLKPGDLIIVAARPGMGKTAVALSYMRGAAFRGHSSLFASLEMSWQQLSTRLVGDHLFHERGGIPAHALRTKSLSTEHRRAIYRARDPIAALPLKVIDQRCDTISKLRRAIRRRRRELEAKDQTLELVVVDYLQLLQPDHRMRSEYEALSEVSRELKAMAKAESVVMLALAQLSREPEKRSEKRPQLSDLRGSGQIEQDADAVIFLYAPEYYLQMEKPDAVDTAALDEWQGRMDLVANRLEFIAPKVRNGSAGTGVGFFFRSYQAVRGGDFRWTGGHI